MSEQVLITERDGAVATLTMNRPRTRNALDPALLGALAAALREVGEDASIRAVVLTGAGGAFCAGADLKAAFASSSGDPLSDVDKTIDVYHSIIRAILAAPKPVLAAVDGAAAGFGCDLALACDLRIASTEGYFQETFVRIGLMPDGGGTFWLPRLVGTARAMEMILTGDKVPAARALELGIVSRVVPQASLVEEALAFARRLAKGPPLAFAAIKRAVREGLTGSAEAALAAEKEGQLRCLRSNDCLEGVAAWMQKREPQFQGK